MKQTRGYLKWLSRAKMVALDTETYARDWDAQAFKDSYLIAHEAAGKKITSVTLRSAERAAEEERRSRALDPLRANVRLLQLQDEKGHWVILDLLDSDPEEALRLVMERAVVGQNLKFDLKMLYHHWPWFMPMEFFDTMIAHKLVKFSKVIGYSPADLGAVVAHWAGVHLDKAEQASDWSSAALTKAQMLYARRDVEYLIPVALKQIRELEENSLARNQAGYFCGLLHDKVATIEMQFVEVVARAELRGVLINPVPMAEYEKRITQELHRVSRPLRKANVNSNSPAQLMKFLNDQGIDVIGTSAEALLNFVEHKIVRDVLKVKELQKALQMVHDYLHEWPGKDLRIRPSFQQIRAATGRMSCSDPNLQQIARPLKPMFYGVSEKDAVLKMDYPAMEMRCMAEVSRDAELIRIFHGKMDLHASTAADVMGKPVEEITPYERDRAKPVNFGFIYGMGAKTFVQYAYGSYGVLFTQEEAEKIRNIFFRKYKGVKRFLEMNGNRLEQSPQGIMTTTLLGRRMLTDRYTAAANFPVQGTAADIFKLSCIIVMRELRRARVKNAGIVNFVHDELVVECTQRDKERVTKIIKASAEKAINYVLGDFYTEVKVKDVDPNYDWNTFELSTRSTVGAGVLDAATRKGFKKMTVQGRETSIGAKKGFTFVGKTFGKKQKKGA